MKKWDTREDTFLQAIRVGIKLNQWWTAWNFFNNQVHYLFMSFNFKLGVTINLNNGNSYNKTTRKLLLTKHGDFNFNRRSGKMSACFRLKWIHLEVWRPASTVIPRLFTIRPGRTLSLSSPIAWETVWVWSGGNATLPMYASQKFFTQETRSLLSKAMFCFGR